VIPVYVERRKNIAEVDIGRESGPTTALADTTGNFAGQTTG